MDYFTEEDTLDIGGSIFALVLDSETPGEFIKQFGEDLNAEDLDDLYEMYYADQNYELDEEYDDTYEDYNYILEKWSMKKTAGTFIQKLKRTGDAFKKWRRFLTKSGQAISNPEVVKAIKMWSSGAIKFKKAVARVANSKPFKLLGLPYWAVAKLTAFIKKLISKGITKASEMKQFIAKLGAGGETEIFRGSEYDKTLAKRKKSVASKYGSGATTQMAGYDRSGESVHPILESFITRRNKGEMSVLEG